MYVRIAGGIKLDTPECVFHFGRGRIALHLARSGAAGDVSGCQAQLIHSLLPSVVDLTVRKEVAKTAGSGGPAAGQAENSRIYVGSGFVLGTSGMIATNHHVVESAYDISVTLSDGSVLPGKVLHASRLVDIAIVQVHVDDPLAPVQ